MNMIWHDDNYVQADLDLVVPHTAIQNNIACGFRKGPPFVGAECDEMRFVVSLNVGKLPSIETAPHSRTMLRQPPSAVGRSEAPRLQCSVLY